MIFVMIVCSIAVGSTTQFLKGFSNRMQMCYRTLWNTFELYTLQGLHSIHFAVSENRFVEVL